MEPADQIQEHEKKIKYLEQELNDLRQGLAVVTDYYRDLKRVSRRQEAAEKVGEAITRPLVDEDMEFEAIWKFHEEVLVADPGARVPCTAIYDAFVQILRTDGKGLGRTGSVRVRVCPHGKPGTHTRTRPMGWLPAPCGCGITTIKVCPRFHDTRQNN